MSSILKNSHYRYKAVWLPFYLYDGNLYIVPDEIIFILKRNPECNIAKRIVAHRHVLRDDYADLVCNLEFLIQKYT